LHAQAFTGPPQYGVAGVQSPAPVRAMLEEPVADEQVVEVRVLGNRQVPIKKILPLIKTRANRAFSPRLIERDVHLLNGSGLFVSVTPKYERVAGGRVVIFEVLERPTLEYVKYVGNKDIGKKTLAKEAQIAEGDPLDPHAVEEARRKIEEYYRSKGFSKARITIAEGNNPTDPGAIFLINEGPKEKVLWTDFIGNTIATDARLRTKVESKHGFLWTFSGEVDEKQIEEDINRLTAYYRSLGFFQARIGRKLKFSETPGVLSPLYALGKKPTWLTLTFVINEGPRYKVRGISVQGNRKYSSDELLDLLELKTGEYFDQTKMNGDVATLRDHYGQVGYIFAEVKPDPRFMEEPGELDLIFDISEGRQYRVGRINVDIDGETPHTRLTTVLNRLSLKPGDIIDIRELRASERRLQSSRLFEVDRQKGVMPTITFSPPTAADIEAQERSVAGRPNGPNGFRGQSPEPRVHLSLRPIGTGHADGEDGLIDVTVHGTWASEEAPPDDSAHSQRPQAEPFQPARTGRMIVRGQNPESRGFPETDSYHWMAATRQGNDPASRDARQYFTPPANTGQNHGGAYFRSAVGPPASPVPGQVGPSIGLPDRSASGVRRLAGSPRRVVRGQFSTDSGTAVPSLPSSQALWRNGPPPPSSSVYRPSETSYPTSDNAAAVDQAFGGVSAASAPSYGGQYVPSGQLPAPGSGRKSAPFFGGDGVLGDRYIGQPPPLAGLRPDEEPPLYIPLNPRLRETQTGRFMFSVGVNSDAGLLGSIIIDEQNFDWRRYPRGWSDIRDFTAWRGDGQRFRIEAVPGTEVQRYSVNFQEPYLLDTRVALGLSGSFYRRRFQWWDEERLGGRVSLGYQFDNDLTGSLAFRAAKINISNPVSYAPQDLLDVVGDSSLFGFQGQLMHDTRDNEFLATEGHLFQMGFEYVIGSYQYPRADVDFRKYFMLRQRPDGSGRHVMSMKTSVAITGDDTPMYEHYFAGGFSTIRGFDFRGASPRANTVPIGGHFSLLASVEYMFPITADDMLRAVIFCDTGTVEPSIDNWSDKYRVSPGVGLRITIPAMGPAPIALDFAFPAVNESGDEIENFSFFVGFLR
jgi:outer membrane protein insertion porin family